ncbi:hypothetical protein [Actinoplanes sp. NPDC051851]|uniref:hypothetical protein n=1 Tax=Actinoplanes sp. NPDC051851 TaxID=3154753 RepID=UPI003428CC6B
MISFWRSYAVATGWAVLTIPLVMLAYLLGYSVATGVSPTAEDLAWGISFSVFLFIPLMLLVDVIVSPAWIFFRRAKVTSVFRLGTEAAGAGLFAAFLAFLAYRSIW